MTNHKPFRVLLFEGRARQCLPFLRAFKNSGCRVDVLCSSKLDAAYASRFADGKILGVCDNQNPAGTTETVRGLLRGGDYDLVVPMTDFAAAILSENKPEFSRYAYVASNDADIFRIAADKNNTMRVCMENGIPCPRTVFGAKTVGDVSSSGLQYPIVVKPSVGYGAIGFKRLDTERELEEFFSSRAGEAGDYVVQEYIPQTDLQYECAMFVDDQNEVKTSLVFSKNRWFPVNGGSSTLNITVECPDIVESCTKLLQAIHWRGAADIDLIRDPRDGQAKIMEINPRVSGSVRICFDAGVDQAKQMLETARGDAVTKYDTYLVGRRLRCSQTDLLWFIKSPDRFRAKPSWFSLYKTRDQVFCWDDPLPWFAFSFGGLFRLSSEMDKRK